MQLVPNDKYIVRWIGRGTVLRILSTCMSSTLLCVGLLLQCAAAEKQSEIQRVSLLEPGGTWKITEFRCEEGAVPENAQLSLHPTTEVTDTAVNLMEHVHLRLYAGLGPAVEVRPLRMLETARYLSEGIQLKLEAETEDVNVNASQNSFTLQRTCANETNMVQHPLHSTPLCMQVVQAFGSYELMRHLLGVRITQDEFVRGNIHMTLTDACTVTVSDISLKLLPPKTLASVRIMSLYIGFTQNDVALFLTEVEDGFIDVLRRTSLFPQFTSPEGSHVLNDEQHTSHLWLSELKKLIEAIEKPATESQANFEFLTLKRESRPRNYDQVVETVSEKEGQPAVSFEFAHDGTSYMMHFARTRGHVFFQNVPIAVISPDLDPTRNHASTVAYPVIGGIPFFVDHGKYLYRRIVLFKVLWSLDRKQKLKKDCSSTHVMFLMKLFCDQNTLIQVFLVTLTMTELLVRRSQNRMVAKETEAYDYFPYLNLFDVSVRVNVAFISFMYSGRCSTLMALRDFEIWLFDTRSALWKEHPLWSSQALSFDSSKYDLETVIEERATSHTQTKPHTWSTKISWIFYMLGISSFFCVLIFVVLLSVFTSTRTRRAESHLLRLRSEKMIN